MWGEEAKAWDEDIEIMADLRGMFDDREYSVLMKMADGIAPRQIMLLEEVTPNQYKYFRNQLKHNEELSNLLEH